MALTQTDLDALDAAIASSELEVTLEGRHVKFDTVDALIKRRNYVAGLLAGSSGSTPRRRTYFPTFTTLRGD